MSVHARIAWLRSRTTKPSCRIGPNGSIASRAVRASSSMDMSAVLSGYSCIIGWLRLTQSKRYVPLGHAEGHACALFEAAPKRFAQRCRRSPDSSGSHGSVRSEEHTYELKSLMRISYAV